MSGIFISYAREDRPRVEKLAGALEKAGFSVWWDRHIAGGAAFSEEIVRELNAANTVIVAWSATSMKSRWVLDEAATAADTGKLLPISFDGVAAPMGFKQLQVINFEKWNGDTGAASFEDLTQALHARANASESGAAVTSSPRSHPAGPLPRRAAIIAAVATAAIVLGFVLWPRPDADDTAPEYAAVSAGDPSIAVLPFADMSAEGDQEYFADGISEELLNSLASVQALKVAGRTSSFAFKGKNEDLREIGKILGVAHILEGSVRNSGDRVRITAQLIKADDGFHLWSETYDRDLVDIFAVQDEIAAEIVGVLTEKLTAGAAPAVTQSARADIGAYGLYLEAKELIRARKTVTLTRAKTLLDQAIEIDPNYAPAYASRGLTESLLSDAPGAYGRTPMAEALPATIAFAEKAIALDPEHPDGHAVLGLAYLDSGETDLAVVSFKRALELNPNHLDARNWLSLTFGATGRYRDVASLQEKTFELDPLYRPGATNVVTQLLNVGEIDRARAVLERLREVDVSGDLYSWSRASILGYEGRVAEVIKTAMPVYDKNPDTNRGGALSFAMLRIGHVDGVRKFDLPFVEVYARVIEGRTAEAVSFAKAALAENPDYYAARTDYIVSLAAAGEYQQLADYYLKTWNGPAEFQDDMFQAFQAELPPFFGVAMAMKETGNEKAFDAIMARWRSAIDFARAGGAAAPSWDIQEADWLALSGRTDEAIKWYEKACAPGDGLYDFSFGVYGVSGLLRGIPEFDRLVARNRERINEERTVLGLSPATFNDV